MNDAELDDRERYLLEQLGLLQQAYMRASKPLVEQLARLRALRPMEPIFIPNGDVVSNYFEACNDQHRDWPAGRAYSRN